MKDRVTLSWRSGDVGGGCRVCTDIYSIIFYHTNYFSAGILFSNGRDQIQILVLLVKHFMARINLKAIEKIS